MKIVVLSGAGISAESGLGTFRDSGGLWEKFKIEDVATPEAWGNNPKLVLDFYNERRRQNDIAIPNKGHAALVELADYFDVSIVTQNIDNLHERAGSTNVLHLHGEITKAKTSELSKDYVEVVNDLKIGDLYNGQQLRPHVVWFGESVPAMNKAERIMKKADVLIVVGTSLNVYPAAGLVSCIENNCKVYLVDPNDLETFQSFGTHIKEKATNGLPKLVKELIVQKKQLGKT